MRHVHPKVVEQQRQPASDARPVLYAPTPLPPVERPVNPSPVEPDRGSVDLTDYFRIR